jgi:ubiquinone/menaquinone biosynthesis C-methylase UbiE
MNALNELKEVLAENCAIRLIENGIYSVLPDPASKHHYDRRANVYDLIVGTRLYNSIMWGSSLLDYVAFARQAVASSNNGRVLDAACGSMLFTAPIYLHCQRKIIAFDQSIVMLRRARGRLINLSGCVPEHVVLLQANLNELPFRPASFHTVLCMNVLHQFENAAALLASLKSMLAEGGHLYLSSLVLNNRFVGDVYLKALHATREFVRPRSNQELRKMLEGSLDREISYRVSGNMAYAATASFSNAAYDNGSEEMEQLVSEIS